MDVFRVSLKSTLKLKIGECVQAGLYRNLTGVTAMTETFEKLKATLEGEGSLTDEDIAKAVNEHGEMTPEEHMWLSAEIHERKRSAESTVTMDQFLEANQVLDSADPDSDEYKSAQKIVDAFLKGS
jgi:hypothetical protein